MLRETKVELLVPWDDDTQDHPAGWLWTELVDFSDMPGNIIVVDFKEVKPTPDEDDGDRAA